MSLQAPSSVITIRPYQFEPNPETLADNSFQTLAYGSADTIAKQAQHEFDTTVQSLEDHGIIVHVFQDDGTKDTPDSVFPNNWFSTHAGGHVAVYPMFTPNRRRERRWDIIEMLKQNYRVQDVIDFSGLEQDNLALEGTGAMVLDHVGRVAYTAQSNRADPVLLERFCTHFNYEPIVFNAQSRDGKAVYHTNVLMGIGTKFALVGLDMIVEQERRKTVVHRLEETDHIVITLSEKQVCEFAGNALELSTPSGRVLAISERAIKALTKKQIAIIESSAQILPLSIPTIETAGGSVRCMIAGIHLSPRKIN